MAAYVHAAWPGQVVSTELSLGVPVDVLRTAAGNAELLVVGADEANPVTKPSTGRDLVRVRGGGALTQAADRAPLPATGVPGHLRWCRARAGRPLGEYPDVTVTDEIVHGDPRHVLTEMSRNAALVVVGSRGQGRLASSLLGTVSRLIRTSSCAVVVARTSKNSPHHTAAAGG